MPHGDLKKTGETGGPRDSRGRFRKGWSGNPAGRPRGSLNSATRAAMLLLDGEAEALTRKAVELALSGDPVALRLCLERTVGARRGRPVAFALPPIGTLVDLTGAMTAVSGAAAKGAITPDEALTLSQMVESFGRTLDAAHRGQVRRWRGILWRWSFEKAQRALLRKKQ